MEPLSNQLKQIATGISKANSPTTSTTNRSPSPSEACPICDGMGYVTKKVPVGHPDFGRAFPCTCQHDILVARKHSQLRAMSQLDAVEDKTFDTFLLDILGLSDEQLGTLRISYDYAYRYAQEPQNWLLFQGTYGSGKTHLAAAIANYQLSLGNPVLFVTAPDLLDHLRSTYGPSSETEYDDLFERVRNAPLLVLDDLGAESSTSWAQEKLYQLIDHRYLRQLCTVITTNSELTTLDPRIRSRIVDRQLTQKIQMHLPDFRRTDAAYKQSNLSQLDLYSAMLFETFDFRENFLPEKERRNLQRAYDVALHYAQAPQDWLLFTGEHGCGKTHLAAAIANYRQKLGENVVLVTAPDLLDYLRATFSPNSTEPFDKRFFEIREAPLLVIDQLDMSNASPWACEKLYQIVNHRYMARLPTVFTTIQPFEELDSLLRSRLLDSRRCHVFAILAPDYRGGVAPTHHRRD